MRVLGRGGEGGVVRPPELDEQRGVAPLDLEGQPCWPTEIERSEAASRISSASAPAAASGRDRGPRVLEVGEEDERGGARRRLGHGPHRHLRDEAERPLRPHHQVGEDVDGPVEVDEGVEAVAARVLGGELVADAGGQRIVAAHLVAQGRRARRGGRVGPAGAARRRPSSAVSTQVAVGEEDARALSRVW